MMPFEVEPTGFRCVLEAWQAHETEVRYYLLGRVHDGPLADDLLQDVFFKAVREGARFCTLDSPRAWLFQVARHALIDHHRLTRPSVPLPDELAQPSDPARPVDALSACLERTLESLGHDDRDVLQSCDIDGLTQRAYAESHGLTLPAVKARLQRARVRLRQHLVDRCGVRFDASGHVCCHGPGGTGG